MHSAAITVFRVRLLLLAMAIALIGATRDGKEQLAQVNPAHASGAAAAVPGLKAKPLSDADLSINVQAPHNGNRAKSRSGSTT